MRLSEIQGEKALDTLADLLEPVSLIIADDEITKLANEDQKIKVVQYILKNHKKEAITILALLDGEDPATYKPSLLSLPKKLLELLSDPDITDLFQSQGLIETYSGSAMENTKVAEQ